MSKKTQSAPVCDVATISAALSNKSDTSFVSDAYRSGDKSDKAAIRRIVLDVKDAAIDRLDLDVAVAAKALYAAIVDTTPEKSGIDPKVAYATYVRSVAEFAGMVARGEYVPESFGLSDESVSDVLTEIDDMSVSPDESVVNRFKAVRTGLSGVRRSVSNHLVEVFSDLPVGTFLTYTEAANVRSEEYGTDRPTPGAVAACMSGKSVPAGLSVSTGKRGVRMVAGIVKSA